LWLNGSRFVLTIAAVTLLLEFQSPVWAGIVYSQDFDSGTATYTVNDPFWRDQTEANGFITKTTNTPTIFPGHPGFFGNDITQDASGTGYFLFLGTWSYGASNIIPTGNDKFFISPTFAVTANTDYLISFSLTSTGGDPNPPKVQAEIGGQLLG